MGSSMAGRDLEFGVATWKPHCGQKRCRDMGDSVGGRDMDLMSRHGRQFGRSRHGFDVAAWVSLQEVTTWN